MPENLYVINADGRTVAARTPLTFESLGIREVQELERWVMDHPDILGERLLVITSQFNRFDRSDRRTDVLALDEKGSLVIVELKRNAARTLADQQAIRYAAMCSTMTMSDALEEMARHKGCTLDEASDEVCRFLDVEELPELDDQPRIILCAGSFDDPELTSAILWLRGFGVDIKCVQLTPYRLGESGDLAVVPQIIIPLPETRHFQVRVERKESKKATAKQTSTPYRELWDELSSMLQGNPPVIKGVRFSGDGSSSGVYRKITFGCRGVHYEWLVRTSKDALDVCLHAETPSPAKNRRVIEPLLGAGNVVAQGMDYEYHAGDFNDFPASRWAEARLRIPLSHGDLSAIDKDGAARTMKLFIERTYPLVAPVLSKEGLI